MEGMPSKDPNNTAWETSHGSQGGAVKSYNKIMENVRQIQE